MIPAPLLIFIEQTSPRAEYIFSTLLNALGIRSIKFTTDKEHFLFNTGAKINYSKAPVSAHELWVYPVGLLSQKNIKPIAIDCFEWKSTKAFFHTGQSDIPFDLFSAAFYLLSRYEEYLEHSKDIFGRYAHTNSLAFKEGFLHQPVINQWIAHLEILIRNKFDDIQPNNRKFTYLPTYDIDIAWSYLHKGIFRNLGGFIRDLAKGEWKNAKERCSVLLKIKNDPFHVYDWLHEIHHQYHLMPVYFFLLSQKRSRYDKNIPPNNPALIKLLKEHSSSYHIGIHPSWRSGNRLHLLKGEIESLHKITGIKVYRSRQHYIRMTMPDTYRQLISAGIAEDFSMGYGSINGFRASYCLPYPWYDIQKEMITPLTIYPFCFMEANSIFEQQFHPQEAFKELQHYLEVTRAAKGNLVTIFHNHLLSDQGKQSEWRKLYVAFLNMASTS